MQRKERKGRGVRTSLDASGYSELKASTMCTFPEPMIGHIPFVSSSPSSTAGPSLFRDKLVCQNQQEREWLASARVISPWNSARTKLRQQDGSAMARIAEARNMPVEVISVRNWTLFFQYYGSTNDRRLSRCIICFVYVNWILFFGLFATVCRSKRYALGMFLVII